MGQGNFFEFLLKKHFLLLRRKCLFNSNLIIFNFYIPEGQARSAHSEMPMEILAFIFNISFKLTKVRIDLTPKNPKLIRLSIITLPFSIG